MKAKETFFHIPRGVAWLFILCIPLQMLAQEKGLYILNRGGNNILSVTLDSLTGTLTEQLNEGLLATYDLVLDASSAKLYWTNSVDHQILSGNAESIGRIGNTLTNDVFVPVDLDIDNINGKLYWADNIRQKVYRANFDGSGQEALTPDSFPDLSSIAVYSVKNLLFFADIDSGMIWSCSLNGKNRKTLMSDSSSYPVRLIIDTIRQKLYWSDDGQNRIERINFDGSDREIFYQGDEKELPFGLYIDQTTSYLYWTDYGKDQIMRADLNGFEVMPVVTTGLDDPVAIIIVTSGAHDRNISPSAEKVSVSVYPNPANNLLTLSSVTNEQLIEQVQIFDKVGKQVYVAAVNQRSWQIDIGAFSEGYYSYSVAIAGQLISGHFSIIR